MPPGYWRASFAWCADGSIRLQTRIHGLAAINYGLAIIDLDVQKFLPEFILFVLISLYTMMTW